jgi:hypothetical protein
MKVALLGNCQVHGLRAGLASHADLDVTAFEVWRLSVEDYSAFDPEAWDLVISQPLSSHYKSMSRASLSAAKTPSAFIHNLYFSGLCPDSIYVGPAGGRVTGPMGDYHSSIVLNAFKSGVETQEAERRMLMDGGGLDAIAAWKASLAEFRRREDEIDVPFSSELENLASERRAFWTFNHPEVSVLLDYAGTIVRSIFDRKPHPIRRPHDDLRIAGVWPIYPWVREAHGLAFGGEQAFETRGRALSAMDFVEGSYRAYEAAGDRINLR